MEAEEAYGRLLAESAELTKDAASALVEEGAGVTVANSLGFEYEALTELPESFACGAKTKEGEAVLARRRWTERYTVL